MALREIKKSDLAGKTIKDIYHESVNMLIINFTDETTLELCAENAVTTDFGSIPGIFVEE
jgi:hypothetical protein